MRKRRIFSASGGWLPRSLAITALLTAPLGCGEPLPEQQLDAAVSDYRDIAEERADAGEELEAARRELHDAEQRVREARRALAKIDKRVSNAQARIERRSTDVAIFRALQKRLLEAPALEREAVLVRVEDGIVTLDGEVASAMSRELAHDLAKSMPGIRQVRVEIDVDASTNANSG